MNRSVRFLTVCILLLVAAPVSRAGGPGAGGKLGHAFPTALSPSTPSAGAAVPRALSSLGIGPRDFAAYGTGTVVHADVLSGLVGLDVAFSGSAFASAAPGGGYGNEMGRLVTPALVAGGGYGRGDGLELGIASPPSPFIGELAEASAPPSTGLIEKAVGPVSVPGLVDVKLLTGQAQARSATRGCVLGANLSYGLGSVALVRLLDGVISTLASPPLREVSQSSSRTAIVEGASGLALMSETRQTIAPITLFSGTPSQFTVEVAGEWVLRVLADGTSSTVHYGPGGVTPSTPVVRILGANGNELGSLTLQQFLGKQGLEVTIPGVATIVVGEDPRAIGGETSSQPLLQPTLAMAAADVVRVQLLGGAGAEVRVGHMEAAVAVPAAAAGGVACPGIIVEQRADPPTVVPGQAFTYTIVVTNPNDGTLTGVKVVDTIATPPGVKYEIVPPAGASAAESSVTWNDIGPLGPGESKQLTVTIRVAPDSLPGRLGADAVATGTYVPPATGPDAGAGPVPVQGRGPVDGPEVIAAPLCTVPRLPGLTYEEAKAAIEAAGCKVGTVSEGGSGDPDQTGKVLSQAPDPGTVVPRGTPVDLTLGGPLCSISRLIGLTEEAARASVEAAGCKLVVDRQATNDPSQVGMVIAQDPPPGSKLPVGSTARATVGGPAVLGVGEERRAAAAAPDALAPTGGIALGVLALLLLGSGVAVRLAGFRRRRR